MAGTARFVIPFGKEGASDRAARAFADAVEGGSPSPLRDAGSSPSPLGEGWGGGRLTLENLPGEGGFLGVQRANALCDAREPVLLLGTPTTHVLLGARRGANAAPRAAFIPMIGLGHAPNVLLVSPRLGVDSVQALVERARAKRLTYASAGAGQTIHLCTALFCEQAGVQMNHRPYDGGSATAYDDLISGRVDVYFDNLLGCRDRIAQDDAVALAVSAQKRSALLPDVPTLVECGFPDHALEVWLGVFGATIDAALVRAVERVSSDPGLGRKLAALGLEGGPLDAQAFMRRIHPSRDGWHRVAATFAKA